MTRRPDRVAFFLLCRFFRHWRGIDRSLHLNKLRGPSSRDTIRLYRSFQALKADGPLQKVDNLAVANQELSREMQETARTLLLSPKMSAAQISKHRTKLRELSKKIDANDAEIDDAMRSIKIH